MLIPLADLTFSQLENQPKRAGFISTITEILLVVPESALVKVPQGGTGAILPHDFVEEITEVLLVSPTNSHVTQIKEGKVWVKMVVTEGYLTTLFGDLKRVTLEGVYLDSPEDVTISTEN